MRVVEYTDKTEEERNQIVTDAIVAGEYLIQDAITAEGKYLTFSNNPLPDVINVPTPEESLWQIITDLQLNQVYMQMDLMNAQQGLMDTQADLQLTNQALTDAQLELEVLKGGTA